LSWMKALKAVPQNRIMQHDEHSYSDEMSSWDSDEDYRSDNSERAAKKETEPERLQKLHDERMLSRDRRNEYRLVAIIDYDPSSNDYVAHVVKSDNKARWWYTFADDWTFRPQGRINEIMEGLKSPHMLFYERM
jgi:hypothetical protein